MNLIQLRSRIFELYYQKQWQQALAEIEANAPSFSAPADVAKLIFWKACFLCRLEQPESALIAFQDGQRAGLWWSEMRLRYDEDLQPLQGNPAYEALIAESIRRHGEAQAIERESIRLVSEPAPGSAAPYPCLLALHGYGGNAAETLPYWTPLTAHGWLVAALQSSQLADMNDYHWMDEAKAAQDVQRHLTELGQTYPLDSSRLAIGGFSNGGRTAVMLTLTGVIQAKYAISIVSSLRVETLAALDWPTIQASGAPRLLLIAGEKDEPTHTRMLEQAALFKANGLDVTLQIVPGMGHVVPPDLVTRMTDWLG